MGRPKKKRPVVEMPVLTEADAKLIDEELRDYAGCGGSTDPDDHIWLGEIGELDPSQFDQFLRDDRDPEGALREILGEIINSRPNDERGRTAEGRLDEAFSSLMGKRQKPGVRPTDDKPIIDKAARLYFERHVANLNDNSWRKCIFDAHDKLGIELPEDPDERETIYERIYDKIAPSKDALLVAASAVGLEEWEN